MKRKEVQKLSATGQFVWPFISNTTGSSSLVYMERCAADKEEFFLPHKRCNQLTNERLLVCRRIARMFFQLTIGLCKRP